jgi:hypothetical protein
MRGGFPGIVMGFGTGETTILVEAIQDGPDCCRLVGHVEPAEPGRIELRDLNRSAVRCDQWGRFEVTSVPRGRLSLRWVPDSPTRPPVNTTWVEL